MFSGEASDRLEYEGMILHTGMYEQENSFVCIGNSASPLALGAVEATFMRI